MTTRFLVIALTVLFASTAYARDKEKIAICTGAASCSEVLLMHFGRDSRLEVALDDDTGCPATATYSIEGKNSGGANWHDVVVLSADGVSSYSMDPSVWFPTWRAVPSDSTGCSSLEVNLWVTRN